MRCTRASSTTIIIIIIIVIVVVVIATILLHHFFHMSQLPTSRPVLPYISSRALILSSLSLCVAACIISVERYLGVASKVCARAET